VSFEEQAKQDWLNNLTDDERQAIESEGLVDEIWDEVKAEVQDEEFRKQSRVPKTSKEKRKMIDESRKKNRGR
jgi:hypothetical protein